MSSLRDAVVHGVRKLKNINLPGDRKETRSLQRRREEGRRTGREENISPSNRECSVHGLLQRTQGREELARISNTECECHSFPEVIQARPDGCGHDRVAGAEDNVRTLAGKRRKERRK